MRIWRGTIAVLLFTALILDATGCNWLKKKIDQNVQEKKTISLDLVPDWTPLYAAEFEGMALNTLCSAKLSSIDSFVQSTSEASVWNEAKGHLYAVNIEDLIYAVGDNQSVAGGSIDLYLVDALPSALPVPTGMLNNLHIDTSSWMLARGSELSASAKVASLPIPANKGEVGEWADAEFVGDGQGSLEDQFMNYNSDFGFCLVLNIPTHTFTSATPDLKFELHTDLQLVFVPI